MKRAPYPDLSKPPEAPPSGVPDSDQWDAAKWAGVPSPWHLAETAVANLSRVFLWGPPGVGKSHLAMAVSSSRLQISLSEDLTVQELIGHFVPDRTEWRWHYGPVSRAFKEGRLLVLNEIGRASDAVRECLLGVLDSADVASLALPNGEVLTPSNGFKVIGTSNTGPEELDPALRSRFEAEVFLPEPHPGLLRELDRRCRGAGAALGDSFQDPERALDPRRLISFLNLLDSGVGGRSAALLAFGDRAPDVLAAMSARGVKFQCDTM